MEKQSEFEKVEAYLESQKGNGADAEAAKALVRREIIKRLNKSFVVQGAFDPREFPNEQIPAWLALIQFLDFVNDGKTHMDFIIPIRATACARPRWDKIINDIKSNYSALLAEMRHRAGGDG